MLTQSRSWSWKHMNSKWTELIGGPKPKWEWRWFLSRLNCHSASSCPCFSFIPHDLFSLFILPWLLQFNHINWKVYDSMPSARHGGGRPMQESSVRQEAFLRSRLDCMLFLRCRELFLFSFSFPIPDFPVLYAGLWLFSLCDLSVCCLQCPINVGVHLWRKG